MEIIINSEIRMNEEIQKIKDTAIFHINVSKKYNTPLNDLNEWVRGFVMGAECILGVSLDNKYKTGTFEGLIKEICGDKSK